MEKTPYKSYAVSTQACNVFFPFHGNISWGHVVYGVVVELGELSLNRVG